MSRNPSPTMPELLQKFGVDTEENFKEFLRFCKFPPNKRKFSLIDEQLFKEAIVLSKEHHETDKLIEEIEKKKLELEKSIPNTNDLAFEGDLVNKDLLNIQAVQAGFKLGIEQAEIIAQVIPKAAIKRLNEMILTGELQESFQKIWQDSMQQLGKSETLDLDQLIEQHWQHRQVHISQIEDAPDELAGNIQAPQLKAGTAVTEENGEMEETSQPQSNSPESLTE